MVRTAICIGVVLVLSGCASAPGTSTTSAMNDGSVVRANDDVDHDRVAQIDRVAAQGGVRVMWLNPPRKPAAKSASPSGG